MQILSNELRRYLPEQFGNESRYDVQTYALTKSFIAANHPKVIHLAFGDPDNYGHAGQYDSYLDAAHYLDAMIGSLLNDMQEDDIYKTIPPFWFFQTMAGVQIKIGTVTFFGHADRTTHGWLSGAEYASRGWKER